MPGKIIPPNITTPAIDTKQPVEKNTSGEWIGKDVRNAPPSHDKILRRESDTDSGIDTPDSPLSSRSISSISSSDTTPISPNVFHFDDETAIQAAILAGSAKSALTPMQGGGNAFVYKVTIEDSSGTEHPLVLKAPRNKQQSNDREKDAMESMTSHPNLVRYYGETEIGDKKGLLFEYLPGFSLERVYEELLSTPMPAEERMNAIKYLEQQKFEASAHTNEFDIVHSDLKPSNYLCNLQTGIVKLIDLGEATKTGRKIQGRP